MKLGLVMSVRDEAAILRQNLLYHRHAGVDIVYLYDDGSKDGTLGSIRDLAFVRLPERTSPDTFGAAAEPYAARAAVDQCSRQTLNAFAAVAEARRDGIEWLLHLDADEFASPSLDAATEGGLRELLGSMPPAVSAVRFPTCEMVQRRLEYEDVTTEETLFKRPGARIARMVQDPLRDRSWQLEGFYGHSFGKSAVRLSEGVRPHGVHKFAAADGSELATERRGCLLHYWAHGFSDFRRKHRLTGPLSTYPTGPPVAAHVRLWRELAHNADFSEDALRDYFARFVLFSADEVARLRRRGRRFGLFPVEAAIIEITAVRDALARLGLLDTPGAPGG